MGEIANALLEWPLSVALLITPGFALLPLAICSEILRLANLAAGMEIFTWDIIGLTREPLAAVSNALLTPSATISEIPTPAITIVLGDGPALASEQTHFAQWLQAQQSAGGTVAAIGAGAGLIHRTNLTSDSNVSIDSAEAVIRQVPESGKEPSVIAVPAEQATAELMFSLIADRVEPHLAHRVADLWHRGVRTELAPLPRQHERLSGTHSDARVARIVLLMQERLNTACSISDICALAGVDETTARRLFRRHLGTSPSNYYTLLRLERARQLLSYGRAKVKDVAAAVGFADSASFCHAFRRRYGFPPGKVRGQVSSGMAAS